ncbi:hypothetical protein BX616_008240, partial [Lobosporangium transversale]
MSTSSRPSPIPFLLLGFITGGALLYVSYWVWPAAQRRNSNNSRGSGGNSNSSSSSSNRRAGGHRQGSSNRNRDSGAAHSLRRSNATRRSNSHRHQQQQQQQQQQQSSRRDDHGEGTSSDEEPHGLRERAFSHDTETEETTDHEYSVLVDEDGYERLRMDDFGDSKHDGLQLMNLLYAIAEDQASK